MLISLISKLWKGKTMVDAVVSTQAQMVSAAAAAAQQPTNAQKAVFGADVKLDAKGNPIETGIGSAWANLKKAVADVESHILPAAVAAAPAVVPATAPVAAVPAVTPAVVTPAVAPVTPTVPAATAVVPAAPVPGSKADLLAKLKALEAEVASEA